MALYQNHYELRQTQSQLKVLHVGTLLELLDQRFFMKCVRNPRRIVGTERDSKVRFTGFLTEVARRGRALSLHRAQDLPSVRCSDENDIKNVIRKQIIVKTTGLNFFDDE